MTAFQKIFSRNKSLNSVLCVGLDTDISKLPVGIEKNISGMLEFNKRIINATKEFASSFKLNFAFYERYGIKGMEVLEQTIELIPEDIHIIADAKRGDIGNTSKAYADSAFSEFRCDSITVSPYMGRDSIEPFLEYSDKMVFILALTSNPGSFDFQRIEDKDGKKLYEHVIESTSEWGSDEQIGYVVGATHPKELKSIREIIPNNCLLIPGVGKQGGNPTEVLEANGTGPCLVNSSRGIIYSGRDEENWIDKVRQSASETQLRLSISK